MPAEAKVSLETDRKEYFLGENVLVHFLLTNSGEKEFNVETGGDYRGSTRSLRYDVTAVDENGAAAEDPDLTQMNMGGLVGWSAIKPGQTITMSLPLLRYRRIEKPGSYTIRVTHDFGWKETADRKRPVAETKLIFRMPSAAEAEQVVAAMEELPENPRPEFGQKSFAYQDYGCLQEAVYLDPLLRRAREGKEWALQGIGAITTPEATAALIELAGGNDPALSLKAALALNSRLPDPEFKGELPSRGPFGFDYKAERQRKAALSWKPEFAPKIRDLARRLLQQSDDKPVDAGAFMIETVGLAEDAPAVIAAVQRALNLFRPSRHKPEDNVLDLPAPLPELVRAIRALHSRGWAMANPHSMGELFAYFTLLEPNTVGRAAIPNSEGDSPARSKDWEQMLAAYAISAPFPLREAAVRSIPQPVPESCLGILRKALADPDDGVSRAAAEVAGRSGRPEFIPQLVAIVATEQQKWLLRSASNAAFALGARYELYEAWVERLSDEALFTDAIPNLAHLLDFEQHSSSGRTDLNRAERLALRAAWRKFLPEHAEEIRAGKLIDRNDPTVSKALFGRAQTWLLPDGSYWPSSQDEINRPP